VPPAGVKSAIVSLDGTPKQIVLDRDIV
jgi:hypothetical protein